MYYEAGVGDKSAEGRGAYFVGNNWDSNNHCPVTTVGSVSLSEKSNEIGKKVEDVERKKLMKLKLASTSIHCAVVKLFFLLEQIFPCKTLIKSLVSLFVSIHRWSSNIHIYSIIQHGDS